MSHSYKRAYEFSDAEGFQLVLDSQDIYAICESVGVCSESITGAIVKVGDGEYAEVWLTEWSRPYLRETIYQPLTYFK